MMLTLRLTERRAPAGRRRLPASICKLDWCLDFSLRAHCLFTTFLSKTRRPNGRALRQSIFYRPNSISTESNGRRSQPSTFIVLAVFVDLIAPPLNCKRPSLMRPTRCFSNLILNPRLVFPRPCGSGFDLTSARSGEPACPRAHETGPRGLFLITCQDVSRFHFDQPIAGQETSARRFAFCRSPSLTGSVGIITRQSCSGCKCLHPAPSDPSPCAQSPNRRGWIDHLKRSLTGGAFVLRSPSPRHASGVSFFSGLLA